MVRFTTGRYFAAAAFALLPMLSRELRCLNVPYAQLGPIAVHFPSRVETNEMLQQQFPRWDLKLIAEKTGIRQRYIADPRETSSDLAVEASRKAIRRLRHRPGFDRLCAAVHTDTRLPTADNELPDPGPLGAEYALRRAGLQPGLQRVRVRTGGGRWADPKRCSPSNVLLLTAETYSKFIDQDDRSVRTIFGDAAAATLVTAADERSMWGFQFGSDGSGGDMLLVADGGARHLDDAIQAAEPQTLEQPNLYGRSGADQFHRRRNPATGRQDPRRYATVLMAMSTST